MEPWIQRLLGNEPVDYLAPELRKVLHRTYGVILYQEQVIEVCSEIAGFSPGEADIVRRLMTHQRSYEEFEKIRERFIAGATAKGYSQDVAEKIWGNVRAYGGYGFCEGHAAAFARIGYETAYLLTHHPTEFYCGLLNNQPLGYWPPHVLVTEAKRRGIPVLPLDINESREDSLPRDGAIRIGWKSLRGLSEPTRGRMDEEHRRGGFGDLPDFVRRVRPAKNELEMLIVGGAFDAFHPNRRALLWAFRQGEVDCDATDRPRLDVDALTLPDISDFTARDRCCLEWKALGFSPVWHPMEFRREGLRRRNILTCAESKQMPSGTRIVAAGLTVHPHTPPTKSGKRVLFMTLADETGLLDVTVFPGAYERYGDQIFKTGVVAVGGRMMDTRGLSLIASWVRGI